MRELISQIFHWSDLDPERRRSILLVGGVSLILLFALAAVSYGFYVDRIAFKQETVLRVGDRKYDYGQLERRLLADLGPISSLTTEQFGLLVGNSWRALESEALIRVAAEDQGISVTEQEIEAQMKDDLNLSSEAPRDQFARLLRRELQATGLKLDEYRETAEARALALKLQQVLGEAVPAEAEQIDIRFLQVFTEAEALEAKSAIDDGEPLAALAATRSIHASRQAAGELGWVPRGALPGTVDDVAFSIEIGVISDVIEATDGFYIIEVRAREVREISEESLDEVVGYVLQAMIEEVRDSIGSELTLTSDLLGRLAGSVQSALTSGG